MTVPLGWKLDVVLAKILGWFENHTKVHTELDYRKAYQFKKTFQPKADADYEWVRDYARFNYGRLEAADQTLDAKAESLVRVLAGGSGVLSLGAIIKLDEVSIWVASFWGVALLLALAALMLAALVRFPRPTFLPASIYFAIRYCDAYEAEAESRFLAQWHLACEGMRLSNKKKSTGLKWAMVLSVASIIVLALSFGVALGTMKTLTQRDDPQESGKVSAMADDQQQPLPDAPDPASQPQTEGPTAEGNPAEVAGPQSIQADTNPGREATPRTTTKE